MAQKRALSALSKIGIAVGVAVAFVFGMATTVYLSLRSPEVKVPQVVGLDRVTGEGILNKVGLNLRQRATRPSLDKMPNTILDQSPRAGETVKSGQTIAVVLSRAPQPGETVFGAGGDEVKPQASPPPNNQNQNAETASANNQNENKQKRTNKNSNKNANSNNSNNANARNANNRNVNNADKNSSNANNRNVNGNRNLNTNNHNMNANINNRNANNVNNVNRPRLVIPAQPRPTTTNNVP